MNRFEFTLNFGEEMSRAIIFLIVSIMMLTMPSMMSSLTSLTMTGAGDSAINKSMVDMMQSMTSLVGAMSYIVGIAFGFKGVLAFKEYAEYGVSTGCRDAGRNAGISSEAS